MILHSWPGIKLVGQLLDKPVADFGSIAAAVLPSDTSPPVTVQCRRPEADARFDEAFASASGQHGMGALGLTGSHHPRRHGGE